MLRCEMMYERVLSQPDGGDLQDRVENYFLAWSNSVRRDLQALGVLEATRNLIDELLKIAPADMSNEQLEIAMAFCRRQLALWGRTEEKHSREIEPVEIEEPVAAHVDQHSGATSNASGVAQ
jgi:hypothetical protein